MSLKVEDLQLEDYEPSSLFRNGHFNTIFSFATRSTRKLPYQRERLITPDDDFVDIDLLRKGHKRAVLILHGLESSSEGTYVVSMARHFQQADWDVVAINYRSRSGEINRQKRVYHAGATDDVAMVIDHILPQYEELTIVGFSLGGNLSLKYSGEMGAAISPKIKSVVAISTPFDLLACVRKLDMGGTHYLYQQLFLSSLKNIVKLKEPQFPDVYKTEKLKHIKTLFDFDDQFTGPVNGFDGAVDYYTRSSSKQFIPYIKVPTLILNAQDDPFLVADPSPPEVVNNLFVSMLDPLYGGHVGFFKGIGKANWADINARAFSTRFSELD